MFAMFSFERNSTMFMLDLSGYDEQKRPGVERFGGLFLTAKDAETHGHQAAKSDRLHFRPSTIWVRNEENEVVYRVEI